MGVPLGSRGQEDREGLAQAGGASRKVRPITKKGSANSIRSMHVSLNFD